MFVVLSCPGDSDADPTPEGHGDDELVVRRRHL